MKVITNMLTWTKAHKKILTIVLIVFLYGSSALIGSYYLLNRNEHQVTTPVTKSPEQLLAKTKALISELPLTNDKFSASFNYDQNRFLIEQVNQNNNFKEDFHSWLVDSDYDELPPDYFIYLIPDKQ